MIGAIAGDIIGSVYEHRPIRNKNFPLFDSRCTFTDDSVLTVAIALAILSKRSYQESVAEIGRRFGYDLQRSVDEIRPTYGFEISCQKTVPEAIVAFLDSQSYEDTVRNAISLGGDSDTLGCIAGGVAEAYYGEVPPDIRAKVWECLPSFLWKITEVFCGV
jgi:ADP-ribosylglycohydrolase